MKMRLKIRQILLMIISPLLLDKTKFILCRVSFFLLLLSFNLSCNLICIGKQRKWLFVSCVVSVSQCGIPCPVLLLFLMLWVSAPLLYRVLPHRKTRHPVPTVEWKHDKMNDPRTKWISRNNVRMTHALKCLWNEK